MEEASQDKRVQKYVDPAMFKAETVDVSGPKVYLLEMTSDPLGSIAALSAMYTGKVTRSKDDVTDDERRHHLEEMKKTKLTTPLEAVKLHFMLEGVTRAFTHQLVRNRTSAYAQESMRFAVKEDMPVALPPSLAKTSSGEQIITTLADELGRMPSSEDIDRFLKPEEKMRIVWDDTEYEIREAYNKLVNLGMPAEDARGLAPTNVLTRINWVTDLRTLIDVLGVRLCTQAQFEWRTVATLIAQSISDAWERDRRAAVVLERRRIMNSLMHNGLLQDQDKFVETLQKDADLIGNIEHEYRQIAGLFRPICYKTGKCEFKSDADRACKIRDRVEASHAVGRPSTYWDRTYIGDRPGEPGNIIDAIHPAEWMLDPTAAR